MPLSSAKPGLLTAINSAYENAASDGSNQDNDAISGLASEMANAIHDYFIQAVVTTDVTVNAGQPDTAGGATASTGTGSGIGGLS